MWCLCWVACLSKTWVLSAFSHTGSPRHCAAPWGWQRAQGRRGAAPAGHCPPCDPAEEGASADDVGVGARSEGEMVCMVGLLLYCTYSRACPGVGRRRISGTAPCACPAVFRALAPYPACTSSAANAMARSRPIATLHGRHERAYNYKDNKV